MITQPLNFLQVAQGLQKGLVYTHPTFSVDEYLVLDANGDIRVFDNYELAHIDLTPELVLSTEWTVCEKHLWVISGTEIDMPPFGDEVYLYYLLSREPKEDDDPWKVIGLSLDELVEKRHLVTVKIGANANLSEGEKNKILQLFTGMEGDNELEYTTYKRAPAFHCHLILEQKDNHYLVVKSIYGTPPLDSTVVDYKPFMTMPMRVCIRTSNERGNIYNYDVEQFKPL